MFRRVSTRHARRTLLVERWSRARLRRLMGNVRKKMPKELKGDAMLYRNNITFDLIAVNKAARVEDKSKALEVRLRPPPFVGPTLLSWVEVRCASQRSVPSGLWCSLVVPTPVLLLLPPNHAQAARKVGTLVSSTMTRPAALPLPPLLALLRIRSLSCSSAPPPVFSFFFLPLWGVEFICVLCVILLRPARLPDRR